MASVAESFAKVVNSRAWQGTPIRVGGKTYAQGLGVHADSRLVFQLNGDFTVFHVVPGPDDAHRGTIEMKILVNDKEVFASGPTNSRNGTERTAIEIPLDEDAMTLTLIVTTGDDGKGGDHASWADAYLQRAWEGGFTPPPAPPAVTHLPKDKLEPFLKTYCMKCHGEKRQKGQVRFDQAEWVIKNNDTAQRWQDVLDQLNGGDMPPEDSKMPSDAEMSAALDSLTGALITARQRLTDHGGEIKMRRLNRREYFHTMRELFGFDIDIHLLPENGVIGSFDTVGAEQLFTSQHFERYLEAGRKILTEAFYWNTLPRAKPQKRHYDAGPGRMKNIQKLVQENEQKLAQIRQKKPYKEIGFADKGDQEIFQRQFWINTQVPKKYLSLPHVDRGIYLTGAASGEIKRWRDIDIRGEYIWRVHGGVAGNPEEIRKHISFRDYQRNHRGALRLFGTPEKPETVEIRLPGGKMGNKFQLSLFWSFGPIVITGIIIASMPRKIRNRSIRNGRPSGLIGPKRKGRFILTNAHGSRRSSTRMAPQQVVNPLCSTMPAPRS